MSTAEPAEPQERQSGGVVAHVEIQLFGTEDLRGVFWRGNGVEENGVDVWGRYLYD